MAIGRCKEARHVVGMPSTKGTVAKPIQLEERENPCGAIREKARVHANLGQRVSVPTLCSKIPKYCQCFFKNHINHRQHKLLCSQRPSFVYQLVGIYIWIGTYFASSLPHHFLPLTYKRFLRTQFYIILNFKNVCLLKNTTYQGTENSEPLL